MTEVSREGFDLEAELAKAKEVTEATQPCQSFFTLEDESSRGDISKEDGEKNLRPSTSSPLVDPSSADNPASQDALSDP